jgi:hypothetical protein
LNKVKEYYIKFINVLINDYNNYACYSHFLIISYIFKVLENLNTDVQNLGIKKEIIISNFDTLKKNIYRKNSSIKI